MLTLVCPTCRGPLTVHEAGAGTVVACPHCRRPLAVPALALAATAPEPTPDANPFAVDDDTPRTRRRYKPRSGPGGTMWVFGVALLVVVAVLLANAAAGLIGLAVLAVVAVSVLSKR